MRYEFIETRNVQAGRKALLGLTDVERGNPGLGFFFGRAGTGKTVFAREYAVRTGSIYLRALEDWTAKAMLSRLCREINGIDGPGPSSVDRCKQSACEGLEENPRVILLDEADRLTLKLIEHLRDIHDMVGVPVVFIGEEMLYPMLRSKSRIWDRISQKVRFGTITAEDIMMFGLKSAGLKVEPGASMKLESRSRGTFRVCWVDMFDLEQMARANDTKVITPQMVDALPSRESEEKALTLGGSGKRGGKRNG